MEIFSSRAELRAIRNENQKEVENQMKALADKIRKLNYAGVNNALFLKCDYPLLCNREFLTWLHVNYYNVIYSDDGVSEIKEFYVSWRQDDEENDTDDEDDWKEAHSYRCTKGSPRPYDMYLQLKARRAHSRAFKRVFEPAHKNEANKKPRTSD